MAGHSLQLHVVMGVLVLLFAQLQNQRAGACDTCDVTDEPVSLLQKVLQVDTGRLKKSHHKLSKAAEIPATMYAVVVSEPNPSNCTSRINDVGPAAQGTIAAGCQEGLDECNSTELMCVPNFDRAKLSTFDTPGVPDLVDGKAIVQVAYSSVNPCDYKGVMGMRDADVPYVPGIDLSGVVVKAAPGCAFKPGDVVWGHAGGAWGEFDVSPCDALGLKPSNIGLKEAGVMSLVAGTARAAFEAAKAPWTNKPTVLILGGTSGTGISAIQLAKYFGAGKIITTCSERNFDMVKSFGADEAMDYHTQNWWEVLKPRSVDIIFDSVNLWDTGGHAYEILADNGYLLTLIPSSGANLSTASKRPSIVQHTGDFNALPSTTTEKLDWLKAVVEAGKFRMPIYRTYPLAQAAAALELSYEGHVEGKVAIHVGNVHAFALQSAMPSLFLPLVLATLLSPFVF